MNFNIGVRKKQLENLDQFISSSKDGVESILDYFGWNTEKISEVSSKYSIRNIVYLIWIYFLVS